jgi:hypothetical protein
MTEPRSRLKRVIADAEATQGSVRYVEHMAKAQRARRGSSRQ